MIDGKDNTDLSLIPLSTETKFDDMDKSVFFDEEVQPQFFHLIRSARVGITFVTPYIDLWENLKRAMDEAISRKVNITFFIREGATHKPEDLKWLGDHVKLYQVPNLHAKVYLNERKVLISSMNILRSSINDSKEFAMIVKNAEDAKKFRDYVSGLSGTASITPVSHSIGNYVSSLIGKVPIPQSSHSLDHQTSEAGRCIRCGDKIRFNTDKPLCADCYHEWAKYEKETYPEKYCHSCGKSVKTTFEKPQCLNCWKKSN